MVDTTLEDKIADFLVDGVCTVQPSSMTARDHLGLYADAAAVYATGRSNGSRRNHLDLYGDDGLRQSIPDIDRLLADPAVVETLEALMGEDYVVHTHCYLHDASTRDQVFHQDGNLPWNERGHYRPHRPEWALLFYYPQEVTLENGPTEVALGTHYWTKDFERSDGTWAPADSLGASFRDEVMQSDDREARDRRNTEALESLGVPGVERRFMTVPAGTVAICSYDVVHRGSRQLPDQPDRFLFKFCISRARSPRASQRAIGGRSVRPELEPVLSYCDTWLSAAARPPSDGVPDSTHLFEGREDQKVACAYELAAAGDVVTLTAGLVHNVESVRRASGYGLRAGGPEAIHALIRLAGHPSATTRRPACFALGNDENAGDEQVIEVLVGALADPDDLVRSNAASALGQLSRGPLEDPQRVFDELLKRLHPDIEADNSTEFGLPRSTVRGSLAHAALLLATNHAVAVDTPTDLTEDRDRYVAGPFREIARRLT
ncbi:MAG: HEAT repeat domain-containing protein [Actinomycetota bacterium]